MIARIFCVIAIAVLLSACAKRPDYSAFLANHPRSILVVPAANQTTAVSAPDVLSTTISAPLAERGYYVFPIHLTRDILRDLGLTNEGLVSQFHPNRFREIFGADAILFVTIKDWTTKYVVLASNVTVHATYKLVDTRTGQTLWEGEQRTVHSSGGGNIIVAVVSALVTTTVDYRPLSRQTNDAMFRDERRGLPAGPYHPDYQKDYGKYQ